MCLELHLIYSLQAENRDKGTLQALLTYLPSILATVSRSDVCTLVGIARFVTSNM